VAHVRHFRIKGHAYPGSCTMNDDDISPTRVVFLFDVDNTLLDNDRVAADLQRHLASEIGAAGTHDYWGSSSNSGPSWAMRIILALCKGTGLNIRMNNSSFAYLIFLSAILSRSVFFPMRSK
jgi:hypothetical protein